MESALSGIRILDFSRYQAGPFATVMLSDMGAEVIKVEEPRSEPGRATGMGPDGFSAMYEANNRGKKSVTVNLHSDEGREIVRRHCADLRHCLRELPAGDHGALGSWL